MSNQENFSATGCFLLKLKEATQFKYPFPNGSVHYVNDGIYLREVQITIRLGRLYISALDNLKNNTEDGQIDEGDIIVIFRSNQLGQKGEGVWSSHEYRERVNQEQKRLYNPDSNKHFEDWEFRGVLALSIATVVILSIVFVLFYF